jgi:two-component system cell cycle response regulator DivK
MSGELILVVEDNERNLKLVRDVLQFKGFRTLEADTAQRGVELAAEHLPMLILMDVQLPDMDGVAALGRLKADLRTASIPVIALTAYAMKEDRERFLKAGFSGYVPKPINTRTFPEQVRAFIAGDARASGPPHSG